MCVCVCMYVCVRTCVCVRLCIAFFLEIDILKLAIFCLLTLYANDLEYTREPRLRQYRASC